MLEDGRRRRRGHRRGDDARLQASGRPAAPHRHRRARRAARHRRVPLARRSASASRRPPCCAAWSPRASSAARPARASTCGTPRELLTTNTTRRTADDRVLPSYVNGAVVDARMPAAAATATEVRDASTGEVVARVSTEGLDLGAALEYARTVGQALARRRSPSTSARCCSSRWRSRSPSARTSSTSSRAAPARRSRTRGSTSTAASACSSPTRRKGRREMPNSQGLRRRRRRERSRRTAHSSVGTSTPACPVSPCRSTRSTSRCGARSRSSRPAFLAGMPTLVKPATPTGYLAEAFVRILVESGLLPEGSLQLVSGSVPDLFDHLRLGDLVAFTGSASTAERLRAQRLGADRRRALHERDRLDQRERARHRRGRGHARVRRVRQAARRRDDHEDGAEVHRDPPGDRARGIRRRRDRRRARAHRRARRRRRPARRGRHDGPARLDSRSATRCCARSASSRPGGGELVIGSTDAPTVDPRRRLDRRRHRRRVRRARCCCASPMPRAPPCTRSRRSGRSRRSSATTRSPTPSRARRARRRIARHERRDARPRGRRRARDGHRRLQRPRAASSTATTPARSTGHGSPLPNLVHGGPGRAGGGEELGGIRAVLHHMQRTAVQGSPEMLTALTGRLARGRRVAARRRAPVPQVARRAAHRRPGRVARRAR